MYLKTTIALFFTFIFLSHLSSAQYPGTNLRGQILTSNGYQQFPLAYAKVDLIFFDGRYPAGQQWRIVTSTSTDAYGWYGFSYIIPNNYSISVNGIKSYNISVQFIDYRYYQFQVLPAFFY